MNVKPINQITFKSTEQNYKKAKTKQKSMLPELPVLLQRYLQQLRVPHKAPEHRMTVLDLLVEPLQVACKLGHTVVHIAQTDKRNVERHLVFKACFYSVRPAGMDRLEEVFLDAFDVVMEAGGDCVRVNWVTPVVAAQYLRLQGSLVFLPGTLGQLLLRKSVLSSGNFRFPDLVQDWSLGVVADGLGVLVEAVVQLIEEGKGFS